MNAGIVDLDDAHATETMLMEAADQALYRAKAAAAVRRVRPTVLRDEPRFCF